jgi:hypothetical protein
MTATLDAVKAAQTYAIDKMHSEVAFQVRHLLTKVRGRFTEFAGTVVFDQEHPEQSSAALTIEAPYGRSDCRGGDLRRAGGDRTDEEGNVFVAEFDQYLAPSDRTAPPARRNARHLRVCQRRKQPLQTRRRGGSQTACGSGVFTGHPPGSKHARPFRAAQATGANTLR